MSSLLLLVCIPVGLYLLHHVTQRRSRKSKLRRWLHRAVALYRWVKRPRWTPHLVVVVAGAATVVPVALMTWVSGSLVVALRCFVAIVAVVALLLLSRWATGRRRAAAEVGLPLSWRRWLRDTVDQQQTFSTYTDRWAVACDGQSALRFGREGRSPKLQKMQETIDGSVRALVDPGAVGGDVESIVKLAPVVLPGIMKCEAVSVLPAGTQGAWITFYKSRPLQRPIRLAELPLSGRRLITFGVDEFGDPAAVAYGLSTLVVGETGSGKSKFGWNEFADIIRDGRPTELYVINPKNTELSVFKRMVGKRIANIRIMDYIGGDENLEANTVALFTKFVAEMKNRQQLIEEMGLRELVEPTEEIPARYVWVDEMSEIPGAYKATSSPMITAISQGRTSLDWVLATDQVAKVENLGAVRDRFPLKVCLRTATAENTKAALGIGEDKGPACSLIPRSMPGVGYYRTEEGEVRMFRTANVTNREMDALGSRGELPAGMLRETDLRGVPTWLYIYPDKCSKKKRTAYIGITDDLDRRLKEHRLNDVGWCHDHDRVENWFKVHCDETRVRTKQLPSRSAAEAAEEWAIKDMKPHFNIQHNRENLFSNAALAGLDRKPSKAFLARLKAAELVEAGRGEWAVHQVKVDLAKADRVAADRAARDAFEVRVLEDARQLQDSWAA